MFRGVLNRLTAHFGSDEDADDEASKDSRFIPSVLDWSVRYAHGGGNTGGEREIANIKEQARRIEERTDE